MNASPSAETIHLARWLTQMGTKFVLDAEGLQDVLAMLPDIVLVIDPEGRVQYINRVEEGYDRDEVIGTHAHDILDPGSIDAFDAAMAATRATGESQEYEVKLPAPDGSEAWYHSKTHPIRREGEVVAVLLLARNVTDRKAAEAELRDLRRLLPVCSWCGRIRNDEGQWEEIETYLEREARAQVSHGLCPTCSERHFADVEDLAG